MWNGNENKEVLSNFTRQSERKSLWPFAITKGCNWAMNCPHTLTTFDPNNAGYLLTTWIRLRCDTIDRRDRSGTRWYKAAVAEAIATTTSASRTGAG